MKITLARTSPNLSLTLPTHVFQAPSFTPDEQHLGTSQPVPLYRHVQATAWSRKTGIAGLPSHQVPLSAITRMGLQEWALRPLSQGKYTGVILTRSVAESVMCARFLHHLRAKQ